MPPGGGNWKDGRYQSIHQPMSEAADALPLGPHTVRENFTDIDPDYCPLRKCEETNEAHQKPDEGSLILFEPKYRTDPKKTQGCPYRPDKEKHPAANPIDNQHCQSHANEVGNADEHSLKVTRSLVKPSFFKDVV